MDPDFGPTLDTVYVPGNPGAAWTGDEIESTRQRPALQRSQITDQTDVG